MRSIKLSFGTSLFASVLFMFSGYFIFCIDMHHLDVEIFLPLVFLCFENIVQGENILKWGTLGSLAVFMTIVGGQPQSSFLILSFGCLYFLFRVFSFKENRSPGIAVRHFVALGTSVLFGFLFAAFLLVPFYEFMRISSNNHAGGVGLTYDPYLSDAMSFFVPYFLGPIHESWLKGYSWHILTRGYVGVTAVFFALTAFFVALKTKDRQNYFIYFFIIGLGLMLAKFYGFPLVHWIGKLPVANKVNFGKYMGPLYAFCFAVLAGCCLERMSAAPDLFDAFVDSMKKAVQVIVVIMLCTFAYHYRYMVEQASSPGLSLWSFKPSRPEFVAAQMLMAFGFISALAVAYWFYARKKRIGAETFKLVVGCVALMELFIYIPNAGLAKNRNPRYDIFEKAPYIDFLQKNLGYHRVIGVDRILYPDFASAFGIGDLRVLDALLVTRYMKLIHAFFTCPEDRFTGDEGMDFETPGTKRILDLLGVKYILSNTFVNKELINEDIVKRGKIVSSPGGPKEQWINASRATINGSSKQILFEHAPSCIDYQTRIPKASVLDFSIGLLPGAWDAGKGGDGVRFEIIINDRSVKKTIFSQYLDPKNRPKDRKWFDCSVDLTAYGGKYAVLSFVTMPPGKNNAYDWSVWGDIKFAPQQGSAENKNTYRLVYNQEIKIIENQDVFPRAFVVHDFEQGQDEKRILETLRNDSFDLRKKIVIEGKVPDDIRSKLSGVKEKASSIATIDRYTAQSIDITSDMTEPGFLVLSDTYYPGWKAVVDGRKTRIFAADYALRAVFLDKGVHHVNFVYDPDSFRFGLWISLAGLISAFVLGVVGTVRKGAFGFQARGNSLCSIK